MSVAVGGTISDTATLKGSVAAGGIITFSAYRTAGCTGPPAFTSTRPISGNASSTSANFTRTAA